VAGDLWGRSADDWDALVRAGLAFLVEQAKLNRYTTYTELDAVLVRRTGLRGFDFNRDDDRAAMGHLLGAIVDATFPRTGLMISAIVLYLNENNAGTGFYALAKDLGLLPPHASETEKEEFWVSQVKAVYKHFGSR
jgi:hypothetical protein